MTRDLDDVIIPYRDIYQGPAMRKLRDEGRFKMKIKGQEVEIELVPFGNILPRKTKIRKHSQEQITLLVESIKTLGFLSPILVDNEYRLIAGEARLKAAQALNYRLIPVIRIAGLSRAQAEAFALADNKIAEFADWNWDGVGDALMRLRQQSPAFNLTVTGFCQPEIKKLTRRAAMVNDKEPDRLNPQDVLGDPVTRLGDVWRLGEHVIICGDAREPETFTTLMDGKQARMVFADPPYNLPIERHVAGKGVIAHDEFAAASGELSDDAFAAFLRTTLQLARDHSMDGAFNFVTMDWRHSGLLHGVGDEVYDALKNICVWNKSNGGMGSLYRSKHEFIYVFKVGTAPHVNNIQLGKNGRNRANVWDYPAPANAAKADLEAKLHPTMKPIGMVADAILDVTHPDDIVLDPFLGSGTTLLAAHREGRRAYGVEIEPGFVDLAIRRYQRITGEEAILVGHESPFSAVDASRNGQTP